MSRYEGLNLPELMQLLHAPVVPDPVSWAPATPGWWVALAWLVAVTVIAAAATVRWLRRNAYRRQAEAELRVIEARAGEDSQAAAAELAALLKRTALAAYPRREVAALYGDAWARFLVESSGGDTTVASAADQLARAAYRDHTGLGDLVPAARRWIRLHRA